MASSTTLSFKVTAGSLASAYDEAAKVALQFFDPVQPSETIEVHSQRATVVEVTWNAGGDPIFVIFDVEFIARCGRQEEPF